MSKFVDKLFNFLGYEKIAQVKPSDYPTSFTIQTPQKTSDKDIITDSGAIPGEPNDIQTTTRPEQISGDPRMTSDQRDIDQYHKEDKDSFRPFNMMQDEVQNPNVMPTNTTNIDEISLKPKRLLGIEAISKLNKKIAEKMEKLGVVNVDEDLFMKKYEEWYDVASRIAAQRKIPISEVFDELV